MRGHQHGFVGRHEEVLVELRESVVAVRSTIGQTNRFWRRDENRALTETSKISRFPTRIDLHKDAQTLHVVQLAGIALQKPHFTEYASHFQGGDTQYHV